MILPKLIKPRNAKLYQVNLEMILQEQTVELTWGANCPLGIQAGPCSDSRLSLRRFALFMALKRSSRLWRSLKIASSILPNSCMIICTRDGLTRPLLVRKPCKNNPSCYRKIKAEGLQCKTCWNLPQFCRPHLCKVWRVCRLRFLGSRDWGDVARNRCRRRNTWRPNRRWRVQNHTETEDSAFPENNFQSSVIRRSNGWRRTMC